ncbi:MAG: hypothetical protein OMM_10680 [Candidatus Magnetoglobus multicellularis str. Araruama]|uniref:Uncharacterized protein n=1 Tax=Candidatus Magnetoglobus multicellularis str. Araruama TaxID=890399 RepID=A0A1V1P0A9_9BACT|nr:MAG: hypothetical protein OMM_10680 [Candidatus Magnetoglobus multicellularis str. Araruama]
MYRCQYLKGHRLNTILAAADCIVPAHNYLENAGTLKTIGVMDHAIAQMPASLRLQFLTFISIVHVLGIFLVDDGFSIICNPIRFASYNGWNDLQFVRFVWVF